MRIAAVLSLILASSGLAGAQGIEPSLGVGFVGLDATHLAVTAATRVYLTRRFSIDPEILYVKGRNDRGTRTSALQFGPGFAYTLLQGRVAPYAAAGIHFGSIRRTFDCVLPSRCVTPDTSFSWTSGSAGAGVRLRLSNSFFVSPEFRIIGDKDVTYFRLTVTVGTALGSGNQ